MKMTLVVLVCASCCVAQDDSRKHVSIPVDRSRPFNATAGAIERGATYPSIVHLKGNVEVHMPVCVTTGPGNVLRCQGEVILHADEVDLHEQTGQMEARGQVTVTRN